MALVTIQRSPSPSTSAAESEDTVDAVEDLAEPSDKSSPNRQRSFSESYFAVKGAALILPQNENECTYATRKITRSDQGEIQHHLQSMFYLLRPQDTIKVAVKLEGNVPDSNRYMAVVSCIGRQDTEESIILGIDCEDTATIGLVFPIWADTNIKLEGDGGFTVDCCRKSYVFKPVSIQAMWSALQSLNKVVKIAHDNRYIPSGLTHTWVGYYQSRINSTRPQITEWNANETIEFFRSQPIEDENDDEESVFKKKIRVELKNIMMRVDLDEASSKMLRTELEKELKLDLRDYRSFIDNEMLLILGQLDSPTLIKDYVYLGSEWNASNLEELVNNGVGYILNISKEIDNFFPGTFEYMNVREWDSEESDLLKYWEDTHKFICKARDMKSKVLVHCKMGISRSASTVMAHLMKEYELTRQKAYDHTKGLRSCVMPNSSFWKQLEMYEGILAASRQREVFKSKSAVNLAEIDQEDDNKPRDSGDFLGHDLLSHNFHHSQSLPGNFDDSVFLHSIAVKDDTDLCSMEFEMGSRSADSAEDSLSDHPSPKPEDAGKIFHIDGDDDDEDDGSDISDGMEDVDWNKGRTNRRHKDRKSESEDDSQGAQQKKLKPDHSWIKSDSADTQSTDGKEEESGKDVRMEVSVEGTGGKEERIVSEVTESVTTNSDDPSKVMDGENTASIHYERENIPWVSGTVQRTRQDIEERYRERTPSTDTPDTITILVDGKPYHGVTEERQGKGEVTHIIEGATVCESTDEPDKSSMEVMAQEEQSEVSHPAPVYQMEEISLPAGIVLRTKKEIEERSQSSSDVPSSPLQRSASLKGESVVSKRRKPDRERRRTCTPILSPESNTEQITQSGAKTSHSDGEEGASSQRRLEYEEGRSSDGEVSKGEHDMKVYKLMGEEVAVEKGIVQKQRRDIEDKHRSRQSSETKDLPPCKPSKEESESSSLQINPDPLLLAEDKNVPKCDKHVGASDRGSQSGESAIEDMPLEFLDIVRDEDGLRATIAVSKIKSAFEKPPETQIPSKSPIVSRKCTEESQVGKSEGASVEKDNIPEGVGSGDRVNQTKKERKLSESDSEVSVSVHHIERQRYQAHHNYGKKMKKAQKKERKIQNSKLYPLEQRSDDRSQAFSKTLEERPASTSMSDQGKSVDTMNIELDENPIDKVRNLVGKFEISDNKSPSPTSESAAFKDKQFPSTTCVKENAKIISDEEEISQISSLPNVYKDPNADILPEESVHLLQLRRNLRKTSLCSSGRPKSADLLKRHHTSPAYSVFALRRSVGNAANPEDGTDSAFPWDKNKIRRMTGKSHPLTKLENRRNNPFYNTM
ncbi:hypothetical protein FSP39_012149 [Pinctada imbricata]|uniref:protein-serine/threonine phosphatase n=1 Tax=Pinctada imbricata TaxID=66713 RepID=A0AA88XWF1_PINIB|nr:hypothetical protein FSP39_012149 [Pinctada imbricata]